MVETIGNTSANVGAYTPMATMPTTVSGAGVVAATDKQTDAIDNNLDRRGEERWHRSLETHARTIRASCVRSSAVQEKAGYGAKAKHVILGLPGPIIALIVAAVAALWDDQDSRYFVVPFSLVGAVFNAVHVFLALEGKAERHWMFSALYGGVVSKIDAQLCRDPDYRRPADEFMAEINSEVGFLNGNAPQPPKGTCGCFPEKKEDPPEPPEPENPLTPQPGHYV